MAEQKGLGSKLLGIFVESGGEDEETAEAASTGGGEKSAAELVAELAGQAGVAGAKRPVSPGVPGKPGAPVAASAPAPEAALPSNLKLDKVAVPASGPLDFNAIFREAGMDAGELDRVKKAEDLLKSLPESTPQPVKKQIVEASLKAFGFEVEKIVTAAQTQKRALDTYVKLNETQTAKSITDAEAQIRAFNEKIAGLRAEIEKRTAGLGALATAAQARKGDVQKVIDFFATTAPTA